MHLLEALTLRGEFDWLYWRNNLGGALLGEGLFQKFLGRN
jgi:hypothetical protein